MDNNYMDFVDGGGLRRKRSRSKNSSSSRKSISSRKYSKKMRMTKKISSSSCKKPLKCLLDYSKKGKGK